MCAIPTDKLADVRKLLRAGAVGTAAARGREHHDRRRRHQREADEGDINRVALMADDGFARAIIRRTRRRRRHGVRAGHRPLERRGELTLVGALAADAMADAIVRAATQAAASNGLPAARDMNGVPASFK